MRWQWQRNHHHRKKCQPAGCLSCQPYHLLQQMQATLIEVNVPEQCEKHNHHCCKRLYTPMVCFEIYFDQTIKKGGQPEHPFESGSQHQWADDCQVSNLGNRVRVKSQCRQCQRTSLAGQSFPGLISPDSVIFVDDRQKVHRGLVGGIFKWRSASSHRLV